MYYVFVSNRHAKVHMFINSPIVRDQNYGMEKFGMFSVRVFHWRSFGRAFEWVL